MKWMKKCLLLFCMIGFMVSGNTAEAVSQGSMFYKMIGGEKQAAQTKVTFYQDRILIAYQDREGIHIGELRGMMMKEPYRSMFIEGEALVLDAANHHISIYGQDLSEMERDAVGIYYWMLPVLLSFTARVPMDAQDIKDADTIGKLAGKQTVFWDYFELQSNAALVLGTRKYRIFK